MPEDPTGQRETTRGTRARAARSPPASERAVSEVRMLETRYESCRPRSSAGARGTREVPGHHAEKPPRRAPNREVLDARVEPELDFSPLRMGLLAFDSLPIQMEAMLS